MSTYNIDIEDRLINGQIGTVCHFMSNHQQVLRVYVKYCDLRAGIKASPQDNLGRSNRWVPIEQLQTTLLKKKSKSSVAVTREQFPLTLSYACIVHRVHEIRLSKAAVSLNLCNQKASQSGQIYVAISCITNFEGLYLTGSYNKTLIKTYVAAKDKYERNCINNLHNFQHNILKTFIYYKPFKNSFIESACYR